MADANFFSPYPAFDIFFPFNFPWSKINKYRWPLDSKDDYRGTSMRENWSTLNWSAWWQCGTRGRRAVAQLTSRVTSRQLVPTRAHVARTPDTHTVRTIRGGGLVAHRAERFVITWDTHSYYREDPTMAPKQRMRIANEKATKNITLRGNVPKSSVSRSFFNRFWISNAGCRM